MAERNIKPQRMKSQQTKGVVDKTYFEKGRGCRQNAICKRWPL